MVSTSPRDRTGLTVFDASPADTRIAIQSRTGSHPPHNILKGIVVTTCLSFSDTRLLDALSLVAQADPAPVTSLSTPATTFLLPNFKSRTIILTPTLYTLSSRTTPSPLAFTSTTPSDGNTSTSPSGHSSSTVYLRRDAAGGVYPTCHTYDAHRRRIKGFLKRSRQRTQSDGGHIGPVLLFLLAMLFYYVMFMHAIHDMLLPNCFCNRLLKPAYFFCPQGPINSFFYLLVIASIVPINKHLDMNLNLTCMPTLSYDKGIAYS